jgi:PIN domain nuclease of toxin-antitoxin system
VSGRLLLDTQALLWWLKDERQLSAAARRAIAHVEHLRFFSIAGAWELTIKCSTGKLKLAVPVGRLLIEHLPANRIDLLGVTLSDLIRLESLAWHHRDPFDRLMAAQAIGRGLTIVSSDAIFDQYGVDRLW